MSTERAGGVRRKKNGLFLASTVNEKNFFNKQVEIGRYIESDAADLYQAEHQKDSRENAQMSVF